MMYSAYMLENLTKGIIIANNPGKDTINRFSTHNIESLFKHVNYALGDDYERQLCERLSRYSTWASKYPGPLPKKSSDLKDTFVLFDDFDIVRKWEKELTRMLIEIIRK